VNQELTAEDFLYDDDYKIDLSVSNLDVLNILEGIVQLEYPQFNLSQELAPNAYLGMSNCEQSVGVFSCKWQIFISHSVSLQNFSSEVSYLFSVRTYN